MGSILKMQWKKSSNSTRQEIKAGHNVVDPFDGSVYEVTSVDDGWAVLRRGYYVTCVELDIVKNWRIIDQRQIDNERIIREWGLKK